MLSFQDTKVFSKEEINNETYRAFDDSKAKTIREAIVESKNPHYQLMLRQIINFVDLDEKCCTSDGSLFLLKDPTITYREVTKTAYTVRGIRFWDFGDSHCFDVVHFSAQGKELGSFFDPPTKSDSAVIRLMNDLTGFFSVSIGRKING